MSAPVSTLQCRFVTRLSAPSLLPRSDVLDLPLVINKNGLNEVLHLLLSSTSSTSATIHHPPSTTFDFIIGGCLLSGGSVKQHLSSLGLSVEAVLDIEYTFAVAEPRRRDSLPLDDWVSSVTASVNGIFVTTYNGTVQVLSQPTPGGPPVSISQQLIKAHAMPIKALCVVPSALMPHGQEGFLTGGKDRRVVLWSPSSTIHHPSSTPKRKKAPSASAPWQAVLECVGHVDSVETISVSHQGLVATAGFDAQILLWSLAGGSTEGLTGGVAESAVRAPVQALEGHTGCVTSSAFNTEDQLVTGSLDGTVRGWAVTPQRPLYVMACDKPIACLSLHSHGVVATAGGDRVIRIWDPRVTTGPVITQSLHSHAALTTAVAFATPANSQSGPLQSSVLTSRWDMVFASSAHDGSVKVWDLRLAGAGQPLHTIQDYSDKVLCVCWSGGGGEGEAYVVAGGADSHAHLHSLSLATSLTL